MSNHRFYLEPSAWAEEAEPLSLCPDEAHHCRDVMRCSVGELVTVFDGRGRACEAEIIEMSRKSVRLNPGEFQVSNPLPAQITLGQAVPKGKNMDLIIQKATELGVAEIVPLTTTNTVVKLAAKDLQKKQQKWQRIAIEACKQCGQNWLPSVTMPKTIPDYISERKEALNVVAAIDETSLPFHQIIANNQPTPESASILIGPEGDLTKDEVEQALNASFAPLSLGPIILRSETAAIYSLSLLVYELMKR